MSASEAKVSFAPDPRPCQGLWEVLTGGQREVPAGEAKVSFALDPQSCQDGAVAARLPTRKVTFARKRSSDWKVGPRYEIVRKLGSGSYGCVCEARDRDGAHRVAIKRTRDVFGDLVTCRRTAREVCILAMLQRHENIVQLFDIVAPIAKDGMFDEIYLVMEVCDSDLGLLLRKDVGLSPRQVRKILYTLVVGLKYLHSGGIWHRDLKPQNCLLNDDWSVKICDFGLARAAGGARPEAAAGANRAAGAGRLPDPRHARAHRELTSHVCTRWYRAPEVILLQDDYTAALDLWSVGCIFGELLGMLGSSRARERRGPLFPGDCCYPLSRENESSTSCRKAAARDQLEMIFATIGTPTAEELDQLDHAARRYVQKFGHRMGHGLEAKVPEADQAALEVLETTLRFGAGRRASASELLEHRIFSEVRRRATEIVTPGILHIKFDHEPDSIERLRGFILKEVRRFQPANGKGDADVKGDMDVVRPPGHARGLPESARAVAGAAGGA